MKNRSSFTIFITILSALACFGLFSRAQAQEGDLGGGNTNEGFDALLSLSSGGFNTALGWGSQAFLTDAFFNTSVGAGTLVFNDGADNVAVGAAALLLNTTGGDNVAVGTNALVHNDTGIQNEAMGSFALSSNVAGSWNVAIGHTALNNADANFNTGVGFQAGQNVIAGTENIYLGDTAGTVDNAGNSVPDESGVIRIGSFFSGTAGCFINGIAGQSIPTANAAPVFVDVTTGQLGTVLVGANGNKVATPQAMLDESLKQQKRIAELEGTIERLAAMVKDQAAQIQKVSAQLEVSKPAPQVVVNKP